MFSLLSWSSTPVRDEAAMQGTPNFLPAHKTSSAPNHIPPVTTMKRKRSESSTGSLCIAPAPKRVMETMSHVRIPPLDLAQSEIFDKGQDASGKQAVASAEGNVLSSSHGMKLGNRKMEQPLQGRRSNAPDVEDGRFIARSTRVDRVADLPTIRTTIEAQFSLEILLKHKELRLIDQELAKCQIALEQLRRCQIIPFPVLSSTLDEMQAVGTRSGRHFANTAPHAPAWAITDGPYSRHYEQWLLHDPFFGNSIENQPPISTAHGASGSQRSMRGSAAEKAPYANTHRTQRGSNNARLKALPHGYPESKEAKGPMIVKRSSDGHMVKLVCLDCRRSNFNSAQGFINHCRIAHSRQFLSHDAAIEASGEEVDVEMDGNPGEASSVQTASIAGLVHPLIRSALQRPSPAQSTVPSPRKKLHACNINIASSSPNAPDPLGTATPRSQPQSSSLLPERRPLPFNPSPQTPHLSAKMAKLGYAGNLNDMVSEAQTRHDFDLSQFSEEEDDDEIESAGAPEVAQSRSTRGILRGIAEPSTQNKITKLASDSFDSQSEINIARKLQSKRSISPLPAYAPAYGINIQPRPRERESTTSAKNTPINLSPNTTDPHPAPSLVSDDGDYDNSHSESESTTSPGIDEEHDHYMHAELLDHDEIGLGESSSLKLTHSNKAQNSTEKRRSRSSAVIHRDGPDQRHVTFATPARRIKKPSDKPEGK